MKFVKQNLKSIRFLVAFTFILFLFIGYFVSSIIGSYCSLSVFGVSFICPLGFLQTFFATGNFVWKEIAALVATVIIVILLGKVFCAWVCPTVLLGKSNANIYEKYSRKEAKGITAIIILITAIISSLILSFPVFCLICPIGLFFGLLFAVAHLFLNLSPTWGLIYFPIVLLIEFKLLKRWCHQFCPIGALLTLTSYLNFFIKPKVDKDICLSKNGKKCSVDCNFCAEGIVIKDAAHKELASCTKCFECWSNCPSGAVKIKLINKE